MTSSARTRRYRDELRRRGLRPVQVWVPDTRAPGFAEQARHECELINEADRRDAIMDWLEEVSLFDEPDAARCHLHDR
jgi:hypothetical protein